MVCMVTNLQKEMTMKKWRTLTATALIVLVCSILLFGVTESHYSRQAGTERRGFSAFKRVIITHTGAPPTEFVETLDTIYGTLNSIVINAAGTDTDYDVILSDENGVVIFTKTDCSTAADPYRYALSEADTAANDFRGVNVGGDCSLSVQDINDSNATSISVTIYYTQNWQ